MSIKIKINDRFSNHEIKLLKDIDIILEEIEYNCDEIYDLSNKTTDKEIKTSKLISSSIVHAYGGFVQIRFGCLDQQVKQTLQSLLSSIGSLNLLEYS